MIDINSHPIWKGHPVWGSVNPFKKRAHLARFFIARHFAKMFPRSTFIGITGSVGKTTTTDSCYAVLSEKYNVIKTETNLDSIFNIPVTLLKARPKKTDKIIFEMGIEYKGEMEFYLTMVHPATAIVTKISLQHSEFLGDLEDISLEKGKLVEQLPEDGFAILNWDDPIVRKMADRTKAKVLYFGTDSKNCNVWSSNYRIKDFKTVFELNKGVERIEVSSNLLGFHQITPLLAAATLGVSLGMPLTSIKKGLEKIESPNHRMEVLAGYNNSIVIDDTHNAAPVAVEEAIETLNHIPARRRIVVLGETKELGEFSEKMHRQIARKIYNNKIDLVFLGTGDTKYIADELDKLGFITDRMQYNLQNPQLVSQLLKVVAKGDVVLVKGSRTVRLDEVVKKIVKSKK